MLVARQRGLDAETFVSGLMALLAGEAVQSQVENPFNDPVVHVSDSEEYQHILPSTWSKQATVASAEWSLPSTSPMLMSLPESEDSTEVVGEGEDGKGTWAGVRGAKGEERRSSRSSVLTAIRKPAIERVEPSGKESQGQRRGWKTRLSGAKACRAGAKKD